jgi:NADPH:quinone reductase-like Zn-dependent oxidoreductase
MIKAVVLSPFVSKKYNAMLAQLTTADLAAVAELMRQGKVTAVIDRRYKLSETPDAVRYQQTGHARGKVIISLE